MVLVFSASSNSSEDVSRELMLAANSKLIIIPFKIDNIEPEPGKQYYLARTHWLDALNPPTREQISLLVETVKMFVAKKGGIAETKTITEFKPVVRSRAAIEDNPSGQAAPASADKLAQPPTGEQKPKTRRVVWLYAFIPVTLIALALGTWLLNKAAHQTMAPIASGTITSASNAYFRAIPSLSTMDVIVSDSFLGNTYNWPVLQDFNDNGSLQNMQIQNGELDYSINCAQPDGCSYFQLPKDVPPVTDFDLSVNVTRNPDFSGGYGGLVFRFLDASNYGLFAVNDFDCTYVIWKVVGNNASYIANWPTSQVVRCDQPNKLSVFARGSSFDFYINDIPVVSAEIDGLPKGRVGIGGGNSSLDKITLVFNKFTLNGSSAK